MPTTFVSSYSGNARLEPLYNAEGAIAQNVALAAGSYARGTVIGEITATPGTYGAYASTDIAAPAAPVPAALGAGGTFAAGAFTVVATFRNGVGETVASPTATVTLVANGAISLPAVTLPAGASSVAYYVSDAPGSPDLRFTVANNGAAVTIANPPAAGAANPPATNTATAATNGTQNAGMILMYGVTVDASGNVSLGTSTSGGEFGQPQLGKAAPAFMGGFFRCQELVGLDAIAVERLSGSILEGTVASGIFKF